MILGTFLFCKGADNIISQRLREDTDKKVLTATNDALLDFSVNGLRTLMMAWKQFKKGEYEAFARRYDKAECALRNRDRKVARASELAEVRLRLLGCSAIEDKLQDQVPETIQYLLQVIIITS
jgi:magnesium-transporting ATPase (P-type)